jgi:WD40 repeat protein
MTRGRTGWSSTDLLLIFCFVTFVSMTPVSAANVNPANMSSEETKTLQQRLTDAGCYKSSIDGIPSTATDDAITSCSFLRIETGMHTEIIRSIAVDSSCRLLASASDDKTVRLWSLPDGKLQRVVRLPIGDGNAGKVFALAMSQDGRWLVAGGRDTLWDKTSVTIVDLSNGSIRRFGAFEDEIASVAFASHLQRIAVGLNESKGLRVLDSETGAELLADRDYPKAIYGLAFAIHNAEVDRRHSPLPARR